MIKKYFTLTKPGIIMGNEITATGGFFLASKGQVDLGLYFATLLGISLIIAAGCVFNNYIDRVIDGKMERTKNRALVRGLISVRNALIYAIILGLIGIATLIIYTNLLTVIISLIGFVMYVVVYAIWKRRSMYGTIIGSISGAVPPLVGYCAVTNRLDAGAIILFLILVMWQMPHFYAIATFRIKDYTAAKIPVLPIKKNMHVTKIHMLFYIIAFTIATSMLTVFGYTGYLYLVVTTGLGVGWLGLCLTGFRTKNGRRWARKMFVFSLVVITVLCFMMAVDVKHA